MVKKLEIDTIKYEGGKFKAWIKVDGETFTKTISIPEGYSVHIPIQRKALDVARGERQQIKQKLRETINMYKDYNDSELLFDPVDFIDAVDKLRSYAKSLWKEFKAKDVEIDKLKEEE